MRILGTVLTIPYNQTPNTGQKELVMDSKLIRTIEDAIRHIREIIGRDDDDEEKELINGES